LKKLKQFIEHGGIAPTCLHHLMPLGKGRSASTENMARSPLVPIMKSAGAGVAVLIWWRIFSRSAVVLWVVNTLAVTT
jgi:hypothetical protein